MQFTLLALFSIYVIHGDENDDHCSECTTEQISYYAQSQPLADVGTCGQPCVNSEIGAAGIYSDYCKCCRGLTRPQCVSQGVNSQCGWAFHEGCGYCIDWGGPQTCGNVNFPWGDNEDHCDPTGVSDLSSCSLEEHQTSVNDDQCDSHCSFEIGACTKQENGDCPTLFDSFRDYMDDHLNLEVADEGKMNTAYNDWKQTVTISSQDETLFDHIVSCVKEKCLGLTTYDVREALGNGVYKIVVVLAWIIALFMCVVIM